MFALLFLPLIRSCEYQTLFTQCRSGARAAVIQSADCPLKNFIVQNLTCDFSCEPGQRLDFNQTSGSLYCSLCPNGTYSIGGGDEYSSWSRFQEDFESYCLVLQPLGWEKDNDCTGWHSNSDSYLVTGTGAKDKWYETDLVFYPVLVKPGFFQMEYRKEIGKNSIDETGELHVYINETSYFTDSLLKDNWKTTVLPLKTGIHKIQIRYNRLINDENNYAMIRKILVQGTKFADFSCQKCQKGNSVAGARECITCEIGYYFEVALGKCLKCEKGFSSAPAAVGWESCYKLPPCQEDWHYYFSECEGGKQKKIYEWNSPLNCDNEGVNLPETTNIDCLPCGPGKFYQSSACQYCPTGTFSYLGAFGSTCTDCGAGKYAKKVSDFSEWSSFPEEFQTACLVNNSFCEYDWETRDNFIVTSPVYYSDSQVLIEGSFEITEKNATVEFSFKTKGKNTKFSFSVNGKEQKTVVGNSELNLKFSIMKGMNLLKWVCFHMGDQGESCEISRITVSGSKFGGARECLLCPVGYVSEGKQDQCVECGAGETSNENNTFCVSCGKDQYVSFNKSCIHCIQNLTPSNKGTYCQLENNTLLIQNSSFLITNLTGSPGSPPTYCSKSKPNMNCYKTFYGPVKGGLHYFYLSVLNPSSVEMPSYTQLFEGHAYAFALINTDQLNITKNSINRPDLCNITHKKIVTNLGREVKEISKFSIGNDSGFIVKYSNGDFCDGFNKFSTVLTFVCAKEETEGWPVLESFEDCTFYFYWPTVYACEVCTSELWTTHNETCEAGKKLVHLFEGEKCIFSDRASHKELVEECIHSGIYKKWPFVFSMLLCSIMLIVMTSTVLLACSKRRGYHRLVETKFKPGEAKLS